MVHLLQISRSEQHHDHDRGREHPCEQRDENGRWPMLAQDRPERKLARHIAAARELLEHWRLVQEAAQIDRHQPEHARMNGMRHANSLTSADV